MRVLLLMRGAPGVGKSTYIEQHGLTEYSLSADNIRMMYQSPVMQVDGSVAVAQTNEKDVWSTLFQVLEARMQRGEFVVVDATNSKTSEMNRYKDLAEFYRYRMYCVDFTDVPIEECKRRNRLRPPYKQVPDTAIDKMYARFETQSVPSRIKVIKPEELDQIWFKPIDLSSYKKIHHIGDIHGCNTVLQEYLKDGLKDDEMYIFVGDYIDRGIENAAVLNFINSIAERKNVLLLEGNHERWIWCWANGGTAKSKEFEKNTRPDLDKNLLQKDGRMFYRKIGQCAYYTYHGKTIFVTHAGLSNLPENLTLTATDQMIHGVGRYQDFHDVAKAFEKNTPSNCYQIFGHRNPDKLPVQMSERTFNLEGRVEFGGCLRVVTLDENGFKTYEIQNTVFKEEEKPDETFTTAEQTVIDVVDKMRKSKFIQEKKFGSISSFSFTRDAFYDKVWNKQTTKARGLFIDTAEGKIVARSYEKFFNIDERPETRYQSLSYRLKFPVTAYVKENGFLGLVSYNEETDDFFIASKSTPEGPFAEWMKKSFMSRVKSPDILKQYLKDNNVTLVFECVDMENDPHIIKYDKSYLFLLDIVKNKIEFEKMPHEVVCWIAALHGFSAKNKAYVLNNWTEFNAWYNEVMDEDYKYYREYIEGFVIEDVSGFMVKIKGAYYTLWKHMRSVAQETFKSGNYRRTGSLTTPLENRFFGFCKDIRSVEGHPTHIIPLREMFLEQYKE